MTTATKMKGLTVGTKELQDIIKKLKKSFVPKGDDPAGILRSVYLKSNGNNIEFITTGNGVQTKITLNKPSSTELESLITEEDIKLIDKIKNEDELFITEENITTRRKEIKLDIDKKENYPAIKTLDTDNQIFNVEEAEFKKLIQIREYCSDEISKPCFKGVLFREDDKMFATDSFRLAMRELENNLTGEINIPRVTLDIIDVFLDKKGDYDVKCYLKDNKVKIVKDNIEVITDLIEDKFPNLDQVIPKNFQSELVIKDKKELLEELKYLKEDTKDKNSIIKLEVNEENQEVVFKTKKVKSTLLAEIKEGISIAFNINFLIKSLEISNEDEVKMQFAGQYNPFMVNEQDLILPVRDL